MGFDGVLLHKLLPEFQVLKSGRISKIMESGDTDFVLTIRANHKNYNLMLGLSCEYSRIHLTEKTYDFPLTPKSLTMFLRKHIEGYFIEDIYQYKNDRIVVFVLAGYSEMKDLTKKYLICEIMGRYSNLILADQDYQILEVLKHTGVTEFGRTMLPNAIYQFPSTEKLNPFDLSKQELQNLSVSSPKELCQTLEGISLQFAQYIFKKENAMYHLDELLHQEILPTSFLTENGKMDYYCYPLNSPIHTYNSISEMLDEFYYEADNQAKIKLKTNDLVNFINKQIQKNEKKIKKLNGELADTFLAEEYKVKGELLLSYPNLKKKESAVSVYNYYTNEEIVISLDIRYDVITNSQRFFKKYQKAKTAVQYIKQQMDLANNEIEYFKMLLAQLEHASINDALEIQQELIDQRYMLSNKKQTKKKMKPNFLIYLVDGIEIYVGKNNLQNEYLTHKLAKSNTYWFHIQNGTGSHVIVNTCELDEVLIRTAAMLAAAYSSYKDSSSIAVDYTQVRNIKKIPGKRACFVTYTNQKTIYIDVDKSYLESLRIKK